MMEQPWQRRVEKLREHRTRPDRDLSLGFLKQQFETEVARPHRQLGDLSGLWAELVPPALLSHTRLERLSRGVLHVVVDSSGRLYELDRLLRGGLEQTLITRHSGPAFRRIKLRVGVVGSRA